MASQKAAFSMEGGEAVSVRDVLEVYLLGKLTIPLSGHCGAASTVVKVALTIR